MVTVITLTTDFGTQDGYVGAMKGRILSMAPRVTIIDISHEIGAQSIQAASWCLGRSAPNFPENTIHVTVIDPGVGSDRRPILLRSGDQWYIGPDNGVFSRIVKQKGVQRVYRLFEETRWWKAHRSFDGLALFAPAAACLANRTALEEMGRPIADLKIAEDEPARSTDDRIQGKIMMFDRFGNAITNISSADLADLKADQLSIMAKEREFKLERFYQASESGSTAAIMNSDDLLELCVFGGSARLKFGLDLGDEVRVSPRRF